MSDTAPQDLDKIVSKVKKLLALGGSPNEAEASSAMEKAHALLVQYNLNMEQVSASTGKPKEKVMGQTYLQGVHLRDWKILLMKSIALYNFCDVIVYTSKNRRGQNVEQSLAIVGRPTNALVARLMADYLFETIGRMVRSLKKEEEIYSDEVEAYKKGVGQTLRARLKALHFKGMVESSTALVVQDQELQDFLKEINPAEMIPKDDNKKNTWAWMRGRYDGNNVSLNTQLGSKTPDVTLVITK